MIEITSIKEAIDDEFWVEAMQNELYQFARNDVLELAPQPSPQSVIETKSVFKNKVNDLREVVRNKARLNFKETFAHVACLKVISLLLDFSCFKCFNYSK